HHIVDGNALRDADHQSDAGVGGFEDCIGGKRRRHEDQRGIARRLLHGVMHRIKDRNALHVLPRFTRRHPGDDLRAIGLALRRVKRTFLAGNALHHHPRRFIIKYSLDDPFCVFATDLIAVQSISVPPTTSKNSPSNAPTSSMSSRTFLASSMACPTKPSSGT